MSDIRINKLNNIHTQQANKKAQEEKPEQELINKPDVNHKKASDVLDFMANSGALNKANIQTKQIDPSKHVNSESAARIENVMKAFEETILKSAEVAIGEFGLSEGSAQNVAITAFNQKFLV